MGYRILFYVDNKIRDLPRLVLLKVLLEDRFRHEVAFVPTSNRPLDVAQRWQPHMFVFHHLRKHHQLDTVRHFHESNILSCALSTEYIYGSNSLPSVREILANMVVNIGDVDLYFSSHPQEKTILESKVGHVLQNVHYTGNPSFDFYTDPLRQLLTPREFFFARHDLDPSQPTLLVVTGFTYAHFDPDDMDEIRQQWQKSPLSGMFDPRQAILDAQFNKQLTMEAVAEIARRWPKINIIMRPHPFEAIHPQAMAGYTDYFTEQGILDRLRFVSEGHISHLLNQCDIMLHSTSTSSVEAWLLGLPTISLSKETFLHKAYIGLQEVIKGSDWVHTATDTLNVLEHYLNGNSPPHDVQIARDNLMQKHIPYPPGTIVTQIASRLDALLHQKKAALNRQTLYRQRYRNRRGRLRYWQDKITGAPRSLPLDASWAHWQPPSTRIASQQEIDDMAARIRGVL